MGGRKNRMKENEHQFVSANKKKCDEHKLYVSDYNNDDDDD